MGINVGDKVLLQLGSAFDEAPKGLRRWDECTFIVSRAVTKSSMHYYELKGCKSSYGIPYTVMEEWITVTR